mmetsp:Transcript_6641/g.9881  ORF Transcript_6641/g.9881 Transcript_6641/m.9881 type:complete len:292 (-) Transcript_6641:310-1185(-)
MWYIVQTTTGGGTISSLEVAVRARVSLALLHCNQGAFGGVIKWQVNDGEWRQPGHARGGALEQPGRTVRGHDRPRRLQQAGGGGADLGGHELGLDQVQRRGAEAGDGPRERGRVQLVALGGLAAAAAHRHQGGLEVVVQAQLEHGVGDVAHQRGAPAREEAPGTLRLPDGRHGPGQRARDARLQLLLQQLPGHQDEGGGQHGPRGADEVAVGHPLLGDAPLDPLLAHLVRGELDGAGQPVGEHVGPHALVEPQPPPGPAQDLAAGRAHAQRRARRLLNCLDGIHWVHDEIP